MHVVVAIVVVVIVCPHLPSSTTPTTRTLSLTSTIDQPKMSDLTIEGVPLAFLQLCQSSSENWRIEVNSQPGSPLSLSSTLVTPSTSKDETDQTRLTKNYPDAYTDTHGLPSSQPFIVKTGPAWPKRQDGPNAQPFRRELRPVNGHPIAPSWDGILTDIEVYLKGARLAFTAVMPLGFANVGSKKAFCPLVVAIGVEPETVAFEDAKAVAESVKINILVKAGFDNIDVAVWEFTTSLSGAGAKLPSLDPELDGAVTEFRHPFASTLGIAVAPLKQPGYEGSLGMFLTRGDGHELLALTAAHVARPPQMFPENNGLSVKAAERHHEDIIALGNEAYQLGIKRIQTEVGNLQLGIKAEELRAQGLQGRLDGGAVDTNGSIADEIRTAAQDVEIAKKTIKKLNLLHSHVTEYMPIPDNRCIGYVLHADPIGVSSDGPNGYTRDWAIVKIRKDAFTDDFQGNKIYIGGKLKEKAFLNLMFPNIADREGYAYPEHGLLHLRGVVPLDEILNPKQLDAYGDPVMAVVKNGRTTGTTVGRMSGLKSLVRHYKFINVEFTSRELTVVPYDGAHGAFSDAGDSGSIIAERSCRIVALLTGGGGITNATDVTFCTPYCELEKRIKEVFPGVRLLD